MEVQEMEKKIHWLGHDTFRIDGSKVIYFDPYEIQEGPKADLVLITHDHFDHCVPPDVKKVQKADTIIVTESNSARKLEGDIRKIKPGDSVTIEGVTIEGVPAYNTDKEFHPKANGWLGFIVTIDGVRIYHSGDTDFIPEMKEMDVDIAMLPVSGTYVMNADQAVEAARAINPKLAIPMHYGAIVGDDSDAQKFKKALEGTVAVKILPKE